MISRHKKARKTHNINLNLVLFTQQKNAYQRIQNINRVQRNIVKDSTYEC